MKRQSRPFFKLALHLALPAATLLTHVPAFASEEPRKCHYQLAASMPLGSVQGLLSVEGQINDSPVTFAIDTGASHTILMLQSIKKLGIAYGHVDQSAPGIGGDAKEYFAHVAKLAIGNLKGSHMDIAVLGEISSAPKFDGLMGTDLLYEYDVELSPIEKKMRLFRPDNCKATYLGYWDTSAYKVDLQKMTRLDARESITVSINGHAFKALLDSGASRTLITVEAAAKAGVDLSGPNVARGQAIGGAGSQRVETWEAVFNDISIGGETIKGAKLMIADIWKAQRFETNDRVDHDSQADVVLGMDFFRSHRVLISQLQRRMYFSYAGGEAFGSILVSAEPDSAAASQ